MVTGHPKMSKSKGYVADYGTYLIKNLSARLTQSFGKGFTTSNLKYMRQFYQKFEKGHALRDQLTWTH